MTKIKIIACCTVDGNNTATRSYRCLANEQKYISFHGMQFILQHHFWKTTYCTYSPVYGDRKRNFSLKSKSRFLDPSIGGKVENGLLFNWQSAHASAKGQREKRKRQHFDRIIGEHWDGKIYSGLLCPCRTTSSDLFVSVYRVWTEFGSISYIRYARRL